MRKLITTLGIALSAYAFAQTNAPGITVSPLGTNGSTEITVTITLSEVCVPAGKDMDPSWNTISFHSGAIVGGQAWQNVVAWNDPNTLVFNKVSDGVWSASFTPNNYYGVATEGFSFVFNGFPNTPGDWDAEAKAFDAAQNCSDFFWYFNDEPASVFSPRKINLNVFPNPAKDFVNIQFEALSAGNFSVEVFNTLGQRAAIEHLGFRSAGIISHQINLAAVPAGVYFVKLNNGNDSIIKKITVN
jgi:hypothetical protein